MSHIDFWDSTTRDGIQSLWALRLTAAEALAIAPTMDEAGFKVIEYSGIPAWRYSAQFLKEDYWERTRLICEAITKTPLNMMLRSRGVTDFTSFPKPLALPKLWIKRWCDYGIRVVTFLEEENDYGNVPELLKYTKAQGAQTRAALFYSLSPIHTDEHYAQKAREAVEAGFDAIEIKDQCGILTPERTRTLIPAIIKSVDGEADLHFQTHCNTGLGLLCTLEALKLGIKTVRSCLPPMAEGSSNPSTLSIIRNAEYLGFTHSLKMDKLKAISDHMYYIAKKEGLPIGAPQEFDAFYYEHQVPGGVMGTLRWQLTQLKKEHLFIDVLREVAQVRKDMGYPIMVTPASQYIVAQATMNVLSGERYRSISDEVIQKIVLDYAVKPLGGVDPVLLDKIMNLPRTREILTWKP
ncbi:MAG TPA: biotin carboxyl carrier protein, partial [Thermodesulfobacteriota bacterium]|nr:biotin carboxyl carrier protein [Thermodesulfobacteriota bacterium]